MLTSESRIVLLFIYPERIFSVSRFISTQTLIINEGLQYANSSILTIYERDLISLQRLTKLLVLKLRN